MILLQLFVCSLCCLLVCTAEVQQQANDELLLSLQQEIEKSQSQKDGGFIPFVGFETRKGSWDSDIQLNFHGPFGQAWRRQVKCPDNNAFVPLWVSTMLVEAYKRGTPNLPPPSDESISLAVKLMDAYMDKNIDKGSGILFFWPQTYQKDKETWHAQPDNLSKIFDLRDVVKKFPDFIKNALYKIPVVGTIIKNFIEERSWPSAMRNVFNVPPDFDDSFVNLGLGALLKEQRKEFPQSWAAFEGMNGNNWMASRALVQFAYRPESDDFDQSVLDPRTYFWIREFLWEKTGQVEGGLFLPSTWVSNVTLDSILSEKGIFVPLHVNNVDLTVAVNVHSALTAAALANPVSSASSSEATEKEEGEGELPGWFNEEVLKVYTGATDLMVWSFSSPKSLIFDRRDIVQLYYPSIYNFLWLATRSFAEIETRLSPPSSSSLNRQGGRGGGSIPKELLKMRDALEAPLRVNATNYLLREARVTTAVTAKQGRKVKGDALPRNDLGVPFWKVDGEGEGEGDA
eukprot:Cvel_29564.t1-p1 / transcript=Cvel_29564.t1 / gene=Cvel_29564 / organism=Chromera_velia_CCMP2878 / gene_product=hypothetical protein / transcript_product=hypothetical protein / location=Cvel_scaffold4063:1-3527(-) / protein_length=513 / sequence_SO=supercontig / SO=protein_coding / is_pseudo=false